MRVPDANVLLDAVNVESPRHAVASGWLVDGLSGAEGLGFAWSTLTAFVRLSTKAVVFAEPLSPPTALDYVGEWLDRPQATVLQPGERHLPILRELLERAGTGGDLTTDAHLAALAIEHGAELATFDTDFYRFRGLRLQYLG